MEFICSGCGLCCAQVGRMLDNARKNKSKDPINIELRKFPYKAKEDGSCEKLNDDGSCSVYKDRPLICNVEGLYEKYYSHKKSKKDYFIENNNSCNDMIIDNDLPKKFLIDTKQYG